MKTDLAGLLKSCTVKLSIPNKAGWGTGFFIAPDRILTCAHVVKATGFEAIKVSWQDQENFPTATIERFIESSDLALLRLNSPIKKLPCVYLDKEIKPNDDLYTFGYPDDFPNGAPVTFSYEGLTGDSPPLMKFKLGQARPGLSGSPLLNMRTGKVCGVAKFTRDRGTDLGGGGVPMTVIFSEFRELEGWQQEFHEKDRTWSNCLKDLLKITSEVESKVPQQSSGDSQKQPNSPSPALNLWREKLAYLQEQEALATDASVKFQLGHQIKECERKISELAGQETAQENETDNYAQNAQTSSILIKKNIHEDIFLKKNDNSLQDTKLLNGSGKKELREALLDAFRSLDRLEMLLSDYLEVDLNTIVSQGTYTSRVYELLEWSESHNRTKELLEAALKENSRNPKLKTFYQKYSR